MAAIIDRCQALVEEHLDTAAASDEQLQSLLPNVVIGPDGETPETEGSSLPDRILDRIYDLSYEFMEYPEDIGSLGMRYYSKFLGADRTG